jgi:RNA polymerase sigma-70 factor (ECF subfamily)
MLVALDADEKTLPSDSLQDGADREWIDLALAHLPTEQRLTIELAYVLGHSCEEIAAIANCPVNTVKTRLFHARRKLRDLLPRLAGQTQ